MRTLFVSLFVALALCASAGTAAADAAQPSSETPRATTVTLDSFTLSRAVQYQSSNFWCEYNNYGAYFSNYTGACPEQDYVATIHWKKIEAATEYDACVTTSFHDYSPGFACYAIVPPKAGNPGSLSFTFDSAAMRLNTTQAITITWMVKACTGESPFTFCSESNTVSATIPWTG